MNYAQKTIALIDWNWGGHHPTYFVRYAEAISISGNRVVPFCPDPQDFEKRLLENLISAESLKRICKPLKLHGPKTTSRLPASIRGIFDACRFFWGLGKTLRTWEKNEKEKIGLAFFGCIYDRQFEYFRFAEKLFRFPWAGLYLHARSFRLPGSPVPYCGCMPCPEKIFISPNIRAIAVLDEFAVEPLKKLSKGKSVFVFPDITSEKLPDDCDGQGLTHKLKNMAAGRPIVSLTGHLQWTKGLDTFTDSASHPEMKEIFFFLGGDINWTEISPQEKIRLQKKWECLPNFYAHLQPLPETTMNSVYLASDVIFAAYKSFPNSSNALTKSAYFERPIVVSEGYLMAERVREYSLGEVIPEGEVESLVATLKVMLSDKYRVLLSKRARWREYREIHSWNNLKKTMKELLAEI